MRNDPECIICGYTQGDREFLGAKLRECPVGCRPLTIHLVPLSPHVVMTVVCTGQTIQPEWTVYLRPGIYQAVDKSFYTFDPLNVTCLACAKTLDRGRESR